ncbi:Hypothetical predicted protein, partial [Podarcis lilfordi]
NRSEFLCIGMLVAINILRSLRAFVAKDIAIFGCRNECSLNPDAFACVPTAKQNFGILSIYRTAALLAPK